MDSFSSALKSRKVGVEEENWMDDDDDHDHLLMALPLCQQASFFGRASPPVVINGPPSPTSAGTDILELRFYH